MRHCCGSLVALLIVCFAQALKADDLARYVDPGTGISIEYPVHWILEGKIEDGEAFTVNVDHTTNGGRCVIFREEEATFDDMSDQEAVDYLLATDWYETRYRQWFPSFETLTRTRSEISGRDAVEIRYLTNLADIGFDAVVESIDYVVAFDGQLLTFGCFAGVEQFPDLHAVFVDTLKSVNLPPD